MQVAVRITRLNFEPYSASPKEIPPLADWPELETTLAQVAPRHSIFTPEVLPGGTLESIHAANESEFLAIGSAFKFHVLGALEPKIAVSNATWSQPITVTTALKSFPSGITQHESDGTRISIKDLTTRLISIIANTATATQIEFVRRNAEKSAVPTLGHSDPVHHPTSQDQRDVPL